MRKLIQPRDSRKAVHYRDGRASHPRKLKQFVLKPTVSATTVALLRPAPGYYRHGCGTGKEDLPPPPGLARRGRNPATCPWTWPLRTIDEAAALGMEELQLSGGDPMLYPHLIEVIRAARKHPGVFVLMNSVGTGVQPGKARRSSRPASGRGTSPSIPWTPSCTSGCAACGERCRGSWTRSASSGGRGRLSHVSTMRT